MNTIKLRELKNFIEYLGLKDKDLLYSLSILLIYREKKCIGRISLSSILGLSERITRRLIYHLTMKDLLYKDGYKYCYKPNDIIDSLSIFRYKLKDKILVFYKGFDKEAYELVIDKYTSFRDQIVIIGKDPEIFEIFGVKLFNKYIIPGLPNEYYERYISLLDVDKGSVDALYVLWKKYCAYISDSIVLSALSNLV